MLTINYKGEKLRGKVISKFCDYSTVPNDCNTKV